MIAYAIRRIALIIPTLFAIMVVNFVIVQAAPGGPVEQMISRLKGSNVSATERVSGGTGEFKTQAGGAELFVRGVADRAVRRRQLSVDLPVARPRQRQLGLIVLANAHRRLFLAHRIADHRIGDLGVCDPDDADQELFSGGDQ